MTPGQAGRAGAGAQPAPRELDAALAHLRAADPVLARVLDAVGPPEERLGAGAAGAAGAADHYGALVRSIVGQQLSTRAARAIHGRLLEHFGGRAPTPAQLLAADPEAMRAAAGLSRAKVSFLRSLAEHVISGELELDRLDTLDDAAVIAELTAVRGLGEWTSHMFLMFHLGRPDILAIGDLGVRRAVERAYALEDLPSAADLVALAEPWRPYRSAACLVLWRSLDATPA
jgi:DNA-3-methyladenine glycosylase II